MNRSRRRHGNTVCYNVSKSDLYMNYFSELDCFYGRQNTHNMINYCPPPPVLMVSLHYLFQTPGEQEEASPRVTVLINRTVQQLSADLMRKPVDSGESPRYPCFLGTHGIRRTHGRRLSGFWKSFTFVRWCQWHHCKEVDETAPQLSCLEYFLFELLTIYETRKHFVFIKSNNCGCVYILAAILSTQDKHIA